MRTPEDYEQPANRPFVTYDERGSITSHGMMARGIIWDLQDRGDRVLIGEGTDQTHYVDLAGDEPALTPRPVPAWRFDVSELRPRQEATIPNLPPASVTFTGPSSGSQPHDEPGDLQIGWTVPGDYLVTIEAFPDLPITLPLTVTRRSLS